MRSNPNQQLLGFVAALGVTLAFVVFAVGISNGGLGAGGTDLFGLFFTVAVVLVAIGIVVGMRRPAPTPAPARLAPAPIETASGGQWRIDDPEGLILEPNRVHALRVTFTPADTFEATDLRAVLRANEIYWVWTTHTDGKGNTHRTRERRSDRVCEIAAPAARPPRFEAGRAVSWDLGFSLDGLVPSSGGDANLLACEWALEVTVCRAWHGDPKLVAPVIVTQPRDRLNSGIVSQAQFSRYEEVPVVADSGLGVDFIVKPAPLDLAAPASISVRLTNPGEPVGCRGIRLELVSEAQVTDSSGDKGEREVWSTAVAMSALPRGDSAFSFRVPPVNRLFADGDLKHGRLRGVLRFVVDRPGMPDVKVARDMCLCLDRPPAGPTSPPPQISV